jgi:Kdo2-lipid IVA lauroyltransferase/acyltransferase
VRLRYRLEYALAWGLLKIVGALPRPLARAAGMSIAWMVYALHGKLRRVGMRNLELAFPEKSRGERKRILHGVFTSLGRQVAEVCLFPKYTRENVSKTVVYEGFENFERALDNPHIDRMAREYRTMHGNKAVDKDFARGLISALRKGETVGVLMDTNMIASQGVFVNFFGISACTASGAARVALKTNAAVVPGFTIWDPVLQKYRLRFDPAVELIRTGNHEADVLANTAKFTKVIEEYVRHYPDQWLWVHRRWKTRPKGEKGLY